MDYDNKIENRELSSNQRHKDVLLFLNEELNSLQDKTTVTQTYNLEREYAKTKKNKSPFVVLVLFCCFAVTVGLAWIVSRVIEKENQNIEINLSEFEALNLKDLLDSVTKVQDKYDNAVKQQNLYKIQYDSKLKEAEQKRDDDLFLLESLSEIDSESVLGRRRQINNDYYNSIEELKAEYEPKIAELEEQIIQYKQELDSYDAGKIDAAREREKAIDGERQIQEMERQRLVEMYEKQIADLQKQLKSNTDNKSYKKAVNQVSTKYKSEMDKLDPIFEDEQADQIIEDNRFSLVKSFSSELIFMTHFVNKEENEELVQKIQEFEDYYNKYKYLRDIVATVPQKNSVPDYIATTKKLVDKMGVVFEEITFYLQDEKNELLKQIDKLNKELEELKVQHQTELNLREQEYQKENLEFTACINEMLNYTEHDAVVVTSKKADNITVYVTPRKRYSIPDTGCNVEVYGLEVEQARIIPLERGYYKLLPRLDEEGNEISFNLRNIVSGSIVKIVSDSNSK